METYDLVDWFVLVECPYNWQQRRKPLFYNENSCRFSKWSSKIRHIVADSIPLGGFPVIESAQRDYMERGFHDADCTDTIIVSDADEIMSRKALSRLRDDPPTQRIGTAQFLYYYYVNCIRHKVWNGPVALPRGVGRISCQEVRLSRGEVGSYFPITEGGWHFSWLGDIERLQYKLMCHTIMEDSIAFTGQEISVPDPSDAEHLRLCLSTGIDLFRRDDESSQGKFIPIDPGNTHPSTITSWLDKFPDMVRT